MSDELLVVIKEEIAKAVAAAVPPAIETHVNGGIRKIHEILERQNEKQEDFNRKVDAHIEKVEPYLQGISGLGFLWKGLVAVAIGWTAIKGGFRL